MSTLSTYQHHAGANTCCYIAGLLMLAMSGSGLAQNLLDDHLWITNKRVQAVERVGDTLFIGGNFTYVGPVTGPGASFDAATGTLESRFSHLRGHVNVAHPDGMGGWYVGGDFEDPSNISIGNLVHVADDGSITPLPRPDGPVNALLLENQALYVGGDFESIAGTPRGAGAALDVSAAPAASLLAWNPDVTGSVNALETYDSGIIIGGYFESVGGMPRTHLASVDREAGAPLGLSLDFSSLVMDLSRLGDTLYLCGYFTEINGQPRRYTAAVDLDTGQLLPWIVNPSGAPSKILPTDSAVFIAGTFGSVNFTTRYGIAALDPASADLLPWDAGLYPNTVSDAWISEDSNSIYVAGGFTRAGNTPRHRFAELDLDTAALGPLEFHVGDQALAVAKSGNNLFVGGLFNSAGGALRTGAAALDMITGEATDWDLKLPSGAIMDMAAGDDSLFVVGVFNTLGSAQVSRDNAAEVDLITGEPTDWDPPPQNYNQLLAVELTDDYVYIGGGFTSLGGVVQGYFAELDRQTGALSRPIGSSAGGSSRVQELLYDPQLDTLYIGGSFSGLGGLPRSNLAAYDVATGTITDWAPVVFGGNVDALASRGDDVLYLGGRFSQVDGQPRSHAAAISKATGQLTGWDPSPGGGSSSGTVFSLVATDTAVYMGGPLCWMGGQRLPRCHVAAVDLNGQLLGWHPGTAGLPHMEVGSGWVYDLMLDGERMVIAGAYLDMLDSHRGGVGLATSLEQSIAVLGFDPPQLQFGNVETGQTSPPLATTLINSGDAEASGLGLALAGHPDFVIAGTDCGTMLLPGDDCQVQVQFSPTTPGLAVATLSASADPGDASAQLGLGGLGQDPDPDPGPVPDPDPDPAVLHLQPGTLDLGGVPLGVMYTDTFEVMNRGAAALMLDRIEIISGAGAFGVIGGSCEADMPLQPQQSCSVEVGFTPIETMTYAGMLRIVADGKPAANVSLTGSGMEERPPLLFQDRFEAHF